MQKLSFIVGAAALVLAAACGGSATGPAKPDTRIMSAQIDGEAWSAISIATATDAASSIVIQGSNATRTLAVAIPVNQGVGTQVVGSTTPVYAVLVTGSQSWAEGRATGFTSTEVPVPSR